MNVIFLDLEGVLWPRCLPYIFDYDILIREIEKKIIILKEICINYNCKVVISSSYSDAFDPITLKPLLKDEDFGKIINAVYNLFIKYEIDLVGLTKRVRKITSKSDNTEYFVMWKEDEIRLYLLHHPEIIHYCVLDDDDMINAFHMGISDLDKVRKHLILTKGYDKNKDPNDVLKNFDELGLTSSCMEEVGKVLKLENNINKYRKR